MKNLAVASIGAAAFLAGAAQSQDVHVMPYPTTAGTTWETCGTRPELDGHALSLPCGRSKTKEEACPVVVRQKVEGTDPDPVVECDQFVRIGLFNSTYGSTRNIWGIVAGTALETEFGSEVTTKLGLSPGGFQHLCPFACLAGSVFNRCVENPADCNKAGETVTNPKLVGAIMLGGFAQLGKQELAFKFETTQTAIDDHRAGELPTTEVSSEHQLYHGALFPENDSVVEKNCAQVSGNFTRSDFEGECGVAGKIPCPVLSTQAGDCSTGKCKTITFYRPGVTDASTYCEGGTCEPMGPTELQVQVVANANFADPVARPYVSTGPRGILTPQPWNRICPFICGDSTNFLPVCVSAASKCTDGKALQPFTMEFDGKNFTLPGSWESTPVIAVKEVETICRSSAFGTSAPGLLVLAVAAAVTMYSS